MNKRTVTYVIAVALIAAVFAWLLNRRSTHANLQERVIASIIPMTGTAAEFGGYHREAVDLFVDDYNKAAGGSRRLRHVYQDSRSTPKDAVNAAQAIFLHEQPLAVQVQLSGVAMAVAPIVAEKNLLLFSVAGTGGVKTVHKLAFRNYPSPEATAEETARVFLSDRPDSRVAVLWMNDEFGLSVSSTFKRKLTDMRISLVSDESFDKSATDFRATLTKIRDATPSVIYLIGFGNPLGRIIAQLRELGYGGEILGGPEIAFADVLGVAGRAAEGVKFLDLAFNVKSSSEVTQSFIRRYQTRFGRAPTAVSAVVYDGWSLILSAADRVQSSLGDVIAAELRTRTEYDGVCGKLFVNDNRDIVYPLAPKIIFDGKAVEMNTVAEDR